MGNTSTSVENITINSQINKNELIWEDKFQPWNFGNSSEMMTEFFKVLSEKTVEAGLSVSPWRSWKYNDYASLASSIFEKNTFAQSAFKLLFPPKNMPKLKEEICEDLKKLTKKIVFVLDDTDREHPEMVLEVMRLIKSVADFPNLIFILPFDYNKVSSIITKKYGEEYQNYLQKIINDRYQIDNYSYEDLYSIFVYEFRNSHKDLKDLLPQIYEYYRIQVWLIGFRQRIDWLVNLNNSKLVSGKFTLGDGSFIQNVYPSKLLILIENIISENIIVAKSFHPNLNYDMGIWPIVESIISETKQSAVKIYLIEDFNKKLLNKLCSFHSEFRNTRFSPPAETPGLYHNYTVVEIKSETEEEILKEFKDFTFTDDQIKEFLQEFAPSPRDIKAFARKIIVKSDKIYRDVFNYYEEDGKITESTIEELDYILSNQSFDFGGLEETTNKPRILTANGPKLFRKNYKEET